MRQQPLPNRLLQSINEKFPNLWNDIDKFRYDQNQYWHPSVFMPLVLWQKFFRIYFPSMSDDRRIGFTHLISSLAAWRPGQDIIRFEDDDFNNLITTPFKGRLPVSILERVPAWCVYIESPEILVINKMWKGFFLSLEVFQKPELKLLRLLFLAEDMMTYHYVIPLKDWDLCSATGAVNRLIIKKYGVPGIDRRQKVERGIFQAVNLLMRMCASGFVSQKHQSFNMTNKAHSGTDKKDWRFFAADRPHIHVIGADHGSQTIKGRSGYPCNRNAPKPHMRRAHFHAYWSGSIKEGTRKLNLRWLPPIPIAMKEEKYNGLNQTNIFTKCETGTCEV